MERIRNKYLLIGDGTLILETYCKEEVRRRYNEESKKGSWRDLKICTETTLK